MPRLDGTGPLGQGPMTGRKLGFLPRSGGRRLGGSQICKCPKCGTPLSGTFCA